MGPGDGWTHDFNISIIPNSDGIFILRQGDGETSLVLTFRKCLLSRSEEWGHFIDHKKRKRLLYTNNKVRKGVQFQLIGATYQHRRQKWQYHNSYLTGNNLTGITDSTGRTTVLGVSGGKIISVTDFSNHTSTISYSSAGLISSIADPLGNTWNFQYDSNNRMVQKTDPSGNAVPILTSRQPGC